MEAIERCRALRGVAMKSASSCSLAWVEMRDTIQVEMVTINLRVNESQRSSDTFFRACNGMKRVHES